MCSDTSKQQKQGSSTHDDKYVRTYVRTYDDMEGNHHSIVMLSIHTEERAAAVIVKLAPIYTIKMQSVILEGNYDDVRINAGMGWRWVNAPGSKGCRCTTKNLVASFLLALNDGRVTTAVCTRPIFWEFVALK